jgi:hypothetical protein
VKTEKAIFVAVVFGALKYCFKKAGGLTTAAGFYVVKTRTITEFFFVVLVFRKNDIIKVP